MFESNTLTQTSQRESAVGAGKEGGRVQVQDGERIGKSEQKKDGGRKNEPHRDSETDQRRDKETDLHRERLVRWKKQDAELIQKVFDSNTLEMEWTDRDWVEFTAKAIMEQAEDVSREDLYLLHGILVRCQKSVRIEHF